MKHLILGLIVGLVFFLGPGLIDGNFGLVGSDKILTVLPNGLPGLIILGIIYVFIFGLIFFAVKKSLNKSKEPSNSDYLNLTLKFSFGVAAAYIIAIVLVMRAFSNFGF